MIRLLATGLVLGVLLAACGEQAPLEQPPLPGVSEGESEWFWRDVLAAPFAGETAADPSPATIADPAARLDALLERADQPATLMAALRDEQIAVAAGAAHLLGVGGHRLAIPRLLKGIGPYPVDYDVPIEVRAAEASALARLGNPAGIELILALLAQGTELAPPPAGNSWTPTERMAFIQELALEGLVAMAGSDFGFHPTASVPVRTESVRRAQEWWASQAVTLWAAAPVAVPGIQERAKLLVAHLDAYQLRQIDGARYTLAHLGPAVLPLLVEGLERGDDYVRLHCLEIMERLCPLGDDKLAARLAIVAAEPLLSDADTGLAAQGARVCGAARVADPLVLALQRRTEPEVRLAVVDALRRTALPAAADGLAAWLAARPAGSDASGGNPDLEAALQAAQLALDPDRSPDAFLALLASPDPGQVYPALERLIELVGEDHGLDPSLPPDQRSEALAAARAALERR